MKKTDREEMDRDIATFSCIACGVDIVEIEDIAQSIKVGGEQFLQRVYTQSELMFCNGRLPQLAARFAAKEAVSKVLGTGMRGISLHDIEIVSNRRGRPSICLNGRAAAKAQRLRLQEWNVSLSHTKSFAVAFVVSICRNK